MSLKWKLYLAQVRYIDRGQSKLRPVLALSEPVGKFKIVLVAPLYSTAVAEPLPGDVVLDNQTAELGIIRPSTVRLHRITAVSIIQLQEQLGEVPPRLRGVVDGALKDLLDL